jgi:hypothetical protein
MTEFEIYGEPDKSPMIRLPLEQMRGFVYDHVVPLDRQIDIYQAKRRDRDYVNKLIRKGYSMDDVLIMCEARSIYLYEKADYECKGFYVLGLDIYNWHLVTGLYGISILVLLLIAPWWINGLMCLLSPFMIKLITYLYKQDTFKYDYYKELFED